MHTLKRNFAVALAIVSLAAMPVAAGALTVDDIQAQIRGLLSQIADLTKQMNQLQSSSTVSVQPMPGKYRICNILARNLSQGTQGDDVRGLQEFLNGEGYLSAQATGFFGPMTAQAVAKWQAKEGVSAIGSFGPMSRERIKIWCGGNTNLNAMPTRGDAPLTVQFTTQYYSTHDASEPQFSVDFGDGAEQGRVTCSSSTGGDLGSYRCLRWGVQHTYTLNGTYTATLVKTTNTCPSGAQCFVGPMTEVIGKVQINVGPIACTKEYKPVCGGKPIVCITTPCNPVPTTYSNRCEMNADGATFLYEGQCRSDWKNPADDPQCKAWYEGCSPCSRQYPGGPAQCMPGTCMAAPAPRCDAYFNSDNKPPVISGFSGPTTLALNASGTWTINASDPEGGPLSYSIWWGDENIYAPMMSAASAMRDFVQSTTFTHVYANAGTYTVSIVVRDSAGLEVKTTSTVQVGNNVACTMEYAPVCGQPPEPACRHSIPACMMATPGPQTYGNRCQMNAAGATFLYSGQCTNGY